MALTQGEYNELCLAQGVTVRNGARQLLSPRTAEPAHHIDDEADHQNQTKTAATDGRTAKIKPAAAEQEKKNYDEQ